MNSAHLCAVTLSQAGLQCCCSSIFDEAVCFDLRANRLSETSYTIENGSESTGLPRPATPTVKTSVKLPVDSKRPTCKSQSTHVKIIYISCTDFTLENVLKRGCEGKHVAFARLLAFSALNAAGSMP
jgi:hypothetical protein